MEKKTVKQESNPQKDTPKIKICGLRRIEDIEAVIILDLYLQEVKEKLLKCKRQS